MISSLARKLHIDIKKGRIEAIVNFTNIAN